MWRLKVLLSFVLVLCAWTQISAAAQHDYVIDNAPGATVRADINSSLQAIVTNNSGATEPSTTYPNMWWYDTSTSLLKRRNNADDAWITVGLEAASTDGTFAANSDSLVPTQKAAKTYADTKISKSTAAEIYNVSEKTTPASNDVLLLEDSAASYAKKSVKISNIRQSIDAVLPSQTGNSGKFLTTNGSAASWGAITNKSLGSPSTFSVETVYQASTDGFINFTVDNGAQGKTINILIGSSNPPTTVLYSQRFPASVWGSSGSVPVRSGWYYKVTGSSYQVTCYFTPFS